MKNEKKILSLQTHLLFKICFIVIFLVGSILTYTRIASENLVSNNAINFIERQNQGLASRVADYLLDAQNAAYFLSVAADDLTFETMKTQEDVLKAHQKILKTFYRFPKVQNLAIQMENQIHIFTKFDTDSIIEKNYLGKPIDDTIHSITGVVYKKDLKNSTFFRYDEKHRGVPTLRPSQKNLSEYVSHFRENYNAKTKTLRKNVIDSPILNRKTFTIKDKNSRDKDIFLEISLEKLSLFLDSNRISENNRLLLVSPENDLIVDSEIGNNNKKMMRDFIALSLNRTTNDRHALSLDRSNNMLFDYNGVQHFSLSLKTPEYSGVNWRLLSVAPLTDFTSDTDRIESNGFLFALAIFIVLIGFLYFQINRFLQPIRNLEIEAQKIRTFDLEDNVSIDKKFREIKILSEEMQKMKTNVKNFARFIPRALVERLMLAGEEVQLGGKQKQITLLFSDIKSFTSIAEHYAPDDLVFQLSEYFEDLSKVVLDNQGTIDKYIGDAIMAFWGAPESDENQAHNACMTALIMQQKLSGLNKYWQNNGGAEFLTRIGLHMGHAVVGNIGSSERMNYTAIGDNVNLAARLEAANKIYRTSILVSEHVVHAIDSDFVVRPIDIIAVKGKNKSVRIYELMGRVGDEYIRQPSSDVVAFVKDFAKAFDVYLQKDFDGALKRFETLQKDYNIFSGTNDFVTDLYIKRCQSLKGTDLPDDWDGVTRLNSK